MTVFARARALLEADGPEVVGEAADGESAIVEAVRLRPGCVLLDIQLPDVDGFVVSASMLRAAMSEGRIANVGSR
jgi:DNA-binding NarL/FixJ family response regulator